MAKKSSRQHAKPESTREAIRRILDASPLHRLQVSNQVFKMAEAKAVRLRAIDKTKADIKSQGDLDRLHDGCIQYANSFCSLVDAFGPATKNMEQFISLWNSFVQFLNTFPDQISFPNTPENQTKLEETYAAQNRIASCHDHGIDVVLSNLERDVSAFEASGNKLCAARNAFESSPNGSNSLKAIQDATSAAQANLDQLKPYVVIDNQRSHDLFARQDAAFNRAVPCARIDDVDRLRQEYVQYQFSTVPSRASFQQLGAPWNWGDYSYAIMSASVQAASQRIIANGSTSITSAYRNPRKELSSPINGPVNSRHCYGDAVDFAAGDKLSFLSVAKAACAEGPSWVEPARMSSYSHVHSDWRPNGVVISSYCNKPQVPTSFNAVVSGIARVRITWNDHTPSSLDGIKVERSVNGTTFAEIADVNYNVQNYNDDGVSPGAYYYRICAYNNLSGKSEYTPVLSVTVPHPLSA